MATPKDWIVYIDPAGETRAVVDSHTGFDDSGYLDLIDEGNTIIGFVSSGCEADAIKYGNDVLRKD